MKSRKNIIVLFVILPLLVTVIVVQAKAVGVVGPSDAPNQGAHGLDSANAGTRYVAKSGSDGGPNLCLDPANPCLSVGHALGTAVNGDEILMAQGTFSENLIIDKSVTLKGGYESAKWERDLAQYETILDGSGSQAIPGDWDNVAVSAPRVILDNGKYRMWYDGRSQYNSAWGWATGIAQSTDGVNWTKENNNPVLVAGEEGEWDSAFRGQVAILKRGGAYKMWYTGSDGGPWQTGYATSTTGSNWEIYAGNPVLSVGDPGSWDEFEADGPTVLYDNGLYKMWYFGCDSGYTKCSIGYATSPDGIAWIKYANNPVLSGTAGMWDERDVSWSTVLKNGNTYEMWYTSSGPGIGFATSPDGIQWTKHPGNPVLSQSWDGREVGLPTVLLDGSTYKMWFRAGGWGDGEIGYAESADGVNWTLHPNNPVLIPGAPTQWGEPVVRFVGGSDGAVIDGFTITGGSGELAGGIESEGTAVIIRRCLIEDNLAGGFPDHSAGGGIALFGPVTIEDSRIVNNQVSQGAGGIRVHSGGSLVMTNSLVAGNSGDEGLHVNGSVTLMHVTIAHNGIAKGRPGINFNPEPGLSQVIANSILYGNGDSIHVTQDTNLEVRYSIVQGGWEGGTNSAADPWFVNPAGGNFELRPWSPAIDVVAADGAPDHDLNGNPRPHPHNALVDMGAFEYQGTPTTGPIIFLPMVTRP